MSNEEKNIYLLARKESAMTQEEAASLIGCSKDQLYLFEHNKQKPKPDFILNMARVYQKPTLCNHYCSHECEIGREYVPEIKDASPAQLTVEMLNTMNMLEKEKDRFLEIMVDGKISEEEVEDFSKIETDFKQMSQTISALKLWAAKFKN